MNKSINSGTRGPQRGDTAMLVAVVVAVIICSLGVGISWYIKRGYDRQLVIQEWPVITGNVASVSANRHDDTDSDGDTYTYYYPALNGARYTVQAEDTDRSYHTSAEALAVHSVGESQSLYVNPNDPRDARLFFEKLDPNGWVGTALLVMVMFTLMSVGLIFGVWYNTSH